VQFIPDHTVEEISKFQLEDAVIGPVLQAKLKGEKPRREDQRKYSFHTTRLFSMWDQLFVHDSVLFRAYVTPESHTDYTQLVAPKVIQEKILKESHGGTMSGHFGEEKTLERVKQKFYWPGYFNDVRHWCRTCASCATTKTPTPKNRACLKPIVAGYPCRLWRLI
jgi:hypothetical protein